MPTDKFNVTNQRHTNHQAFSVSMKEQQSETYENFCEGICNIKVK